MGRAAVAAIMGAVLVSVACQFDPYTSRYATTQPKREELIGSWKATDRTIRGLSSGPYSKLRPTIELTADGKIGMHEIPDMWRSMSREIQGHADEFVGTWKLELHQDRWWGLALARNDGKENFFGILMVMKNAPPHMLVQRYGDPDNGDGYEFERVVER